MKTLITGAAGFVGQHLIRDLLQAGYEVSGGTLSARPPQQGTLSEEELRRVRWLELDVTSSESVRATIDEGSPEVVYHLAGQSSVGASFSDPLGTWEINATGTLKLLSELGQPGRPAVRVVVISSAEVYGTVPTAEQPIEESRPLSPASPYGASKAAAEMVALQASMTEQLGVVIARSFNQIGPGQDVRFALPSFAHQLARIREGRAEPVLRVGNLSAHRDLLDVRDAVRAYRYLAEHGESGKAYNVCSGRSYELRALVDELVRLSGTNTKIELDPERFRPVDAPLLLGNPARIQRLGWKPEISLSQTLHDILEEAEGASNEASPA